MWLQLSPWPGTTKQCSGEGQEIVLTEGRTMRYAQKQGERGFFTNMRTVLPTSCLLGHHPGSLQVAGAHWRDRIPGETPQNWQDRGIILGYEETMTPKQELAALKEVDRLYRNCPERVAAYTRWRWFATVIAWILIFVAFLLSMTKILSGTLCLVIALLGGFAGGISFLFAASAKQMPLLVRYTALRDEEFQKRLEELKDV